MAQWGQALRGNHVKLVMDSLPAARNLINGGGPVTKLSNLVKEIWKEAKQAGITYRVTWVEREQNRNADQLSKEWANWYRLTTQKRALLERWLHEKGKAHTPIVNTPFSRVGDSIRTAMWKKENVCVVHPVRPAQQWWPHIAKCERVELGMAEDVLQEGGQTTPQVENNSIV